MGEGCFIIVRGVRMNDDFHYAIVQMCTCMQINVCYIEDEVIPLPENMYTPLEDVVLLLHEVGKYGDLLFISPDNYTVNGYTAMSSFVERIGFIQKMVELCSQFSSKIILLLGDEPCMNVGDCICLNIEKDDVAHCLQCAYKNAPTFAPIPSMIIFVRNSPNT